MSDAIKDDGGPAFPMGPIALGEDGAQMFHKGMSLRAWFAGQALAGYRANADYGISASGEAARWAVQDADALIAALKGGAE